MKVIGLNSKVASIKVGVLLKQVQTDLLRASEKPTKVEGVLNISTPWLLLILPHQGSGTSLPTLTRAQASRSRLEL